MTVQNLKPAQAKVVRLTPEQIGIAMSEIVMRLDALQRASILLQCQHLEADPRDVDAMHTMTQSVLQVTGYIAELVSRGVGEWSGFHGEDPMEWFMPPAFFPTDKADQKSAA